MKIIVAGIDPALANFGFAKATYDTETGEWECYDIKLQSSGKGTNKTVRQNSDDLRRAMEQSEALLDWIDDANVVIAEIPGGSQSARGAFGNGVSLGVLAAIGRAGNYRGSIIQVQPTQVKVGAVGSRTASKREMIDWASGLFPNLDWPKGRGGKIGNKAEHIADAVGVINAGVQTDEFKNLVQALAFFSKSASQD